jgi:hypothetical protein
VRAVIGALGFPIARSYCAFAVVKASAEVRDSVFEGMDKPGKACVVVNFGNEMETADVTWPEGREVRLRFWRRYVPTRSRRCPPRSVWRLVPVR